VSGRPTIRALSSDLADDEGRTDILDRGGGGAQACHAGGAAPMHL
jgi:hypothetical protein